MTEKDSGQEDHSKLQLSRRRALQLSSGAAVGGTVFGDAVGEAGASSENSEDDSERDDDEVEIHGPSDQQIGGPTEVIEGATETYRVNRSDHLDIVWSVSNGTVTGEGPRVDVTFGTPGEAEVSVIIAEYGTIIARGDLEVSVAERPHVFVDGEDTVLFGDVSAYEARPDPADADINWRGWTIEPGAAGDITDEGDTASVGFHPEDENEVTVSIEYEIATGEALQSSLDVDVLSRHLGIDCLAEFGIDCSDEVAVGQEYAFEVTGITDGLVFENWAITPSHAGVIEEGDDSAEITFENEASPATIEVEYETESGYRGTITREVDVEQIELQIGNARLVQTVENTRVEDEDGNILWDDEPDPDFVAGRNASIGFDLDGEHVELLKNDVTVVVTRIVTHDDIPESDVENPDPEFVELQVTDGRNDVKDFVDAEHGIEALHKLANSHGVNVPVFSLDNRENRHHTLEAVEIRIESDVVESDPVWISKGTDFEVAEPRTLRVGFIGLKDPDGGENYGEEHLNGRPHDYEENVEEAIELIEKVYPVDTVVAYRHDELMDGETGVGLEPPDRLESTPLRDAVRARDTLEDRIGEISESDTINGNGEITEFDATVLVVPSGYFEFHNGSEINGMVLDDPTWRDVQPQAACLVRDVDTDTMTTPHELAHRFTQELYEGPGTVGHPVAQRDSWDGNEWELDFEHARGFDDEDDGQTDPVGVRSVKFDLTDGEYNVDTTMPPLMSYDSGDDWIDSRLLQYLIENGFEPSPPETGVWDYIGIDPPLLGYLDTDDAERIEVITGTTTIEDDGTATVDYAHRREGKPMASTDDGNVSLTMRSADGEHLGTATTVDEWVGTAEEKIPISGTVPFVVPYPKDIEAIVFDREGTTSTIDPRGSLLASAKDRLAEESFLKNPEDRLPSLQDKLESVEGQLQNRAYRGAYNKLANDIRPRVEEWLHDNAAVPANYYTKSELLDLIDDVIARLEALYDVHEDDKGQGPSDDHPGRGRPEDHPGRGPPDEDEIEGGRGPPDEDEEFGRRPSDDSPGNGGRDDDDRGSGDRAHDSDDDRGNGGRDDEGRGNGGQDDDDRGNSGQNENRGNGDNK